MNVVLPENKIFNRKQIILYTMIIVICVISIIIAFYVQFYARIDFLEMLGLSEKEEKYGNKSVEQIASLKANFEQIFTNSIENGEGQNNKKKEIDKPIVYTILQKKENKQNDYDIDVNIPHINIDNEKIEEYNKEIEDVFINKTNNILESQGRNTVYTVEYVANVQYDILSLMICSNLKEGASAQRVIIQTYNYDLRNNKEISLEEVLKIEQMEKEEIQLKINDEIENEQKKVQDLKDLGYNIYSRDTKSEIYKVENSNVFYVTKDTLYIIYAYGNDTFTSEMDLVVI